MDLKQLEYIVEIAKEKNITHAAEKLFISQSALNQQLLKLEKELGAQLFHRSRTDWHLTEVGEIYIENAKKILEIQKNTYNQIYDCIEHHKRKLTIGLTAGRGIELFTSIFSDFQKLYPNVIVEPVEMSVYEQQKKMEKGELDLGFMTLSKNQRTKDNYIVLYSEEMVLITSKKHPFVNSKAAKEPVDLLNFKDEPFVFMNKKSTNRDVIDEIFKDAGFEPRILFETTYTSSIVRAVEFNLSCAVVPYYYVKSENKNISYFRIKGFPSWDVSISYKKDSYLSKPAQAFIELAKKYCSKKNGLIKLNKS